jgi:hypothetical protein
VANDFGLRCSHPFSFISITPTSMHEPSIQGPLGTASGMYLCPSLVTWDSMTTCASPSVRGLVAGSVPEFQTVFGENRCPPSRSDPCRMFAIFDLHCSSSLPPCSPRAAANPSWPCRLSSAGRSHRSLNKPVLSWRRFIPCHRK